MTVDAVRSAYGARAEDYLHKVGSIDHAHPDDVELITSWARAVDGPVIDAGCGPGQWTDRLAAAGVAVEGVDLTPEFITIARDRFPDRTYRVGRLDDLQVPDSSQAGVLAWYSLIHTPPDELGVIILELARCLRPGGELLIGFCRGDAGQPFDHAVTTAYFWPVDAMIDRLADAGLHTLASWTRDEPGQRAHAAIRARRSRT